MEFTESQQIWSNRVNISFEDITNQGNKIRLVDSESKDDSHLDLYCYPRCSNQEKDVIKSCRGILVSDNKIVLQTYPYSEEYTTEDKEIESLSNENFNELKFVEAHEGSIIRVYNYNNKWYISTHKKIDSFRSKWSSKTSFGQQFLDALSVAIKNSNELSSQITFDSETKFESQFFDTLDTSKCYCFLVRNTNENRIVSKPYAEPTLFHTGTFNMSDFSHDFETTCGINQPKELTFENFEQLKEHVENINIDELQGVIVYKGEKHIKITSPEYARMFEIRGNEPSIKFRYLQLRLDKEKTDTLYSLYPKFTDTFEEYENTIYKICQNIYESYVKRYIHKQYVTLPKEEYTISKACHTWHLEDRIKNRISLRKVQEKMNEQPANNINKMIRRYLHQKNEIKQESPRNQDTTNQEQ